MTSVLPFRGWLPLNNILWWLHIDCKSLRESMQKSERKLPCLSPPGRSLIRFQFVNWMNRFKSPWCHCEHWFPNSMPRSNRDTMELWVWGAETPLRCRFVRETFGMKGKKFSGKITTNHPTISRREASLAQQKLCRNLGIAQYIAVRVWWRADETSGITWHVGTVG